MGQCTATGRYYRPRHAHNCKSKRDSRYYRSTRSDRVMHTNAHPRDTHIHLTHRYYQLFVQMDCQSTAQHHTAELTRQEPSAALACAALCTLSMFSELHRFLVMDASSSQMQARWHAPGCLQRSGLVHCTHTVYGNLPKTT